MGTKFVLSVLFGASVCANPPPSTKLFCKAEGHVNAWETVANVPKITELSLLRGN